MRLALISDTHNKQTIEPLLSEIINNEAKVDILVHAGDLTNLGQHGEIDATSQVFEAAAQNYKAIVFIAGNHDILFEKDNKAARQYFEHIPNCYYLENSGVTIDGFKFWGSPQTIEFFDWAFNVPAINMYKYWDLIPKNTDVLITHQPPFGILDDIKDSMGQKHLGCPRLLHTVKEIQPRLHVFGHIHRDDLYNQVRLGKTQFVNASLLNNKYVRNSPITIVEI